MDALSYYTKNLYWQNHNLSNWHYEPKAKIVFKLANFKEGTFAIEVGCGCGSFLYPFEKILKTKIKNYELIGYDISSAAIKAGRNDTRTKDSKIKFRLGSVDNIDEYVDIIFVIDTLEHVENPYDFLKKLGEKTNTIILCLPIEHSIAHIVFGRPKKSNKRNKHLHFFSFLTARIFINECGYEIYSYEFNCAYYDFVYGRFWIKLFRFIRFVFY